MKTIFANIFIFVVLAFAVVDSTVQSGYKATRSRTTGLFSFPRTGRSQADKTWQITPEEYAEFHSDTKRLGLIPFPRVGRSMGASTRWGTNGEVGDMDPWTMIALKEITSQRDFAPRLDKESDYQNGEGYADQEEAARTA